MVAAVLPGVRRAPLHDRVTGTEPALVTVAQNEMDLAAHHLHEVERVGAFDKGVFGLMPGVVISTEPRGIPIRGTDDPARRSRGRLVVMADSDCSGDA